MVTDCLTPVVAEVGVGTIVTLNNQKVLADGLRFEKINVEAYSTTAGFQYRVALFDNLKFTPTWDYAKLKLYITPETHLFTPNGWKPIEWFREKYPARVGSLIRVYRFRCIVCGNLYMPRRPVLSACSYGCLSAAEKSGMLCFQPLNAKSAPGNIVEDWAELSYVYRLELPKSVEAVRVTNLENASGIYTNGILTSLPELIKAV